MTNDVIAKCIGVLFCVLGVGASCAGGRGFTVYTQSSTRPIQVTVLVNRNDGQVVAGMPVTAGLATNGMWGKTNSNGQAVLVGDVDVSASVVWVSLTPLSKAEAMEDIIADRNKYHETLDQWSFRRYYSVSLAGGVSEYSITLTGVPGSVLSGRTVDATGAPIACAVCARDCQDVAPSKRGTGEFSVKGVSKLASTELFALNPKTGQVAAKPIPAAQASVGGDVGDVAFESVNTLEIDVQVNSCASLVWKPTPRDSSVTLVSVAGKMWTFPLSQTGHATLRAGSTELPRVPAGTYYVVAGFMADSRTTLALLDAIRANRLTELDAAGVPKLIVTVPGGSVSVNAPVAEEAVFSLGGQR